MISEIMSAVDKFTITDTSERASEASDEASSKTISPFASLFGEDLVEQEESGKVVPVLTPVETFKAKFGRDGEALAEALPRFSLDVVGLVAEFAKVYGFYPSHLSPVNKEIQAKFDEVLPILNEDTVPPDRKKNWVENICRLTSLSCKLYWGDYGPQSKVVGVYFLEGTYYHDEASSLVIHVSAGRLANITHTRDTYILIREIDIMNIIRRIKQITQVS